MSILTDEERAKLTDAYIRHHNRELSAALTVADIVLVVGALQAICARLHSGDVGEQSAFERAESLVSDLTSKLIELDPIFGDLVKAGWQSIRQ